MTAVSDRLAALCHNCGEALALLVCGSREPGAARPTVSLSPRDCRGFASVLAARATFKRHFPVPTSLHPDRGHERRSGDEAHIPLCSGSCRRCVLERG